MTGNRTSSWNTRPWLILFLIWESWKKLSDSSYDPSSVTGQCGCRALSDYTCIYTSLYIYTSNLEKIMSVIVLLFNGEKKKQQEYTTWRHWDICNKAVLLRVLSRFVICCLLKWDKSKGKRLHPSSSSQEGYLRISAAQLTSLSK